jgi:hypothetical protein
MHDILIEKARDWQNRNDQENAEININWLTKHVVDLNEMNLAVKPWVFSHIPKTAGTSLESHLMQGFALKDILHVNAPDLLKLPQCIYLKNRYPHLITGHHPIHGLLYQLLAEQKIVHISMMREPIARVVSYYNYIASRDYHALHKQVKDLGFDAFLSQNNLVELNNGQAKRLAGLLHSGETISDKELYYRAKTSIDRCFTLVGVTEQFRAFIQLLEKLCGLKYHHLGAINRSQIKIQLADLKPQQLQLITENNKVDIQLYHYVKSLFNQQYNENFK